MNAQSDLANKVADALHIAEGAKPIPLDEIPDVTVADDTIETVPMEADDSILDFTEDVISPNEVTHENPLPVDTHDTVSTDPLPVSKNRKHFPFPLRFQHYHLMVFPLTLSNSSSRMTHHSSHFGSMRTMAESNFLS